MRELTTEEGEALTKDLQEVLAKHGAELGVVASIQLLKSEEPHETADTKTEESSTSSSGEPTE